jgi:DNA-binding PadR family transcriptional regulator
MATTTAQEQRDLVKTFDDNDRILHRIYLMGDTVSNDLRLAILRMLDYELGLTSAEIHDKVNAIQMSVKGNCGFTNGQVNYALNNLFNHHLLTCTKVEKKNKYSLSTLGAAMKAAVDKFDETLDENWTPYTDAEATVLKNGRAGL